MPNNIEIIQLAKDMITGNCPAQFDDSKTNSKALRDMFIKANGGSTELSIKTFTSRHFSKQSIAIPN